MPTTRRRISGFQQAKIKCVTGEGSSCFWVSIATAGPGLCFLRVEHLVVGISCERGKDWAASDDKDTKLAFDLVGGSGGGAGNETRTSYGVRGQSKTFFS